MLDSLKLWIEPAIVLAVAVLVGYLFRNFFVHRMAVLSKRTKTEVDDLIVEAIQGHIPFWFVLAGFALAVRRSPLDPQNHAVVDKVALALLVLSVSFVAANLATGFVQGDLARDGCAIMSADITRLEQS